ncbi:hypothetical protein CAC42_748 [Sphaceloma murrayae]|uniref:Uncharacterized protein n=1 Tax=Sphaceloma murrayae TaxID=2082308 RepID=A0A2K1QKU2_9PEZI|nr:hypothetical protein CAC42_748 [Sphaceloma murrayae]
MKFTLAFLALAATSFAAPVAEPEPQGEIAVIGQLCAITGITVAGNPARPANVDGVCQTTAVCGNAGGISFGNCAGGGSCCFKFDCAGRNSNSACLNPSLQGDNPPGPGRFVNGICPAGLRCFQLL